MPTVRITNAGLEFTVTVPWHEVFAAPELTAIATERGFESHQPLSAEAEGVKVVTLSREILALVEKLQERWRAAEQRPTKRNLDAILKLRDQICQAEEGCEIWRQLFWPEEAGRST